MTDAIERTLSRLRSALAVSPDNGPLWLQVAELLRDLGRANEARDAAEQARALLSGPDRADAEALIAELAPAPEPPAPDNVIPLQLRAAGAPVPELAAAGEVSEVTFADVGGLDAIKDEIRMKIVLPFQKPEVFAAYGKKRGGGILLYGPPGCGKTLLARATAGECEAKFINVAIDQVLDMWFGESERKLAELFERARASAPAVLFFDELEAIGASRQQLRQSPGRTLVNQLLALMDGASGKDDRILVMAATNAPWHIDPALRRPGRFDRVVFVPPPDLAARAEILRLHLRGKPLDDSVKIDRLAKKTGDYSGADLNDLIDRAVEAPLKDALRTGDIRPLQAADFKRALADCRPTTREWFATAKNYATFANTGGLYDDLLAYLERR